MISEPGRARVVVRLKTRGYGAGVKLLAYALQSGKPMNIKKKGGGEQGG